ncbi:MAG TPA: polysaccharide deacetylase family protein [Gaiellaceae bacterium]|nr:polysaccharide deacetylase family protein [Gaiellaceae bacterium]
MSVLVLTYHEIGSGSGPLAVDPGLFREQLDRIVASGVPVLTVSELAGALRQDRLPQRGVALTFDDGAASVAVEAAPLLLERGLRATVFCVAGHLGGWNDWPSQPARFARFKLASAEALAELAQLGFEIGSHGLEHAPLPGIPAAHARREVVESRERIEQAVGAPVRSFAYPYGLAGAEALVRETYSAACTTALTTVQAGADPYALPRVDVHYLRRKVVFARALDGSAGRYLQVRAFGARARRSLRRDHAA